MSWVCVRTKNFCQRLARNTYGKMYHKDYIYFRMYGHVHFCKKRLTSIINVRNEFSIKMLFCLIHPLSTIHIICTFESNNITSTRIKFYFFSSSHKEFELNVRLSINIIRLKTYSHFMFNHCHWLEISKRDRFFVLITNYLENLIFITN